jgi:hypothetical protein
MTQQEIQERNKEIALMLGKKYKNNSIVIHYDNVCGVNPTGATWQVCLYHSDWNWLMEAVEFIQQKYSTIISHNHCEIHMYDNGKRPINIGSNTTMFATFIAVSDFAKLYNNKEL